MEDPGGDGMVETAEQLTRRKRKLAGYGVNLIARKNGDSRYRSIRFDRSRPI